MAATRRLRLRLLRAQDAVPLREVADAGWVEAQAARTGDRTLSPWAVVLPIATKTASGTSTGAERPIPGQSSWMIG
jgi:hypothetical protein